MPPKPRAARKASIAKEASKTTMTQEKDVPKSSTKDAEMPPPPDPLPPAGILEPEINAMSGCLKNAVVKTGQVYAFYADTRRLGIQKYAPNPPPQLTASLGREVEKFDQLFDAVEAQLLRAITVLQRDLGRERKRLQDTEKAAVASRTRSKSLSRSPTSMKVPLPGPSSEGAPADSLANDQGSTQMSPPPTSGGSGASSGPPGRRSTISLSSLHRPVFPHKLDLSSATLRLNAEDASMFSSGPLASPVTLAPKSARPSTTDIDFMAVFEATRDANNRPVDIDLTLPDTEPPDGNTNSGVNMNVDASLGNSADKPIELDLDIDMSDLFGDTADDGSTDPNASLFSPVAGSHELSSAAEQDQKSVKQENMGMEILDVLSAVGDADGHNDLFSSFQNNSQPSSQRQLQSNTTSGGLSAPLGPSSTGNGGAPSPASILASFAASQMNTDDHPTSSDAHNLPGGDASFDISSIDLAKVFSSEPGSVAEIEELLNSGGFGPTT